MFFVFKVLSLQRKKQTRKNQNKSELFIHDFHGENLFGAFHWLFLRCEKAD